MTIFKKNIYTFIALLLFILDFGVTAYFLRYVDYRLEGNPLFHVDGGFLAILVNVLYIVAIFLLERFVLRRYKTITVEANSGYQYFKNLFKTEKSNFITTSVVFAFIYSTFSSRLVAIIDWIVYGIYRGNFFTTKYAIIRDNMPFSRYDITVAFISFFIAFILWYKIEYHKSKKELFIGK